MNSNFDFTEAVKDIRKLKYNPYIINNAKKTNTKSILNIEKHQIPILTIYKDGLQLNYKIGKYNISKNITNNLYTLKSILNIFDIKKRELIKKFITSQRCNYIINYIDNSYRIPQYIYFIKFDKGIKIGRTFDINQRYQPNKIYNMIYRIIAVDNVNKCEKELKDKFKEKYNLIKGLEMFDISNDKMKSALYDFDDIVKQYKLKDIEYKNTNHIYLQSYNTNEIGKGYYVSSLVASIIFNIFNDTDYNDIKYVLSLIDKSSDKFDKENYCSTFIENGDRFFYWSYHNYKVIANGSKGTINASRLWNTVKKENHIDDKYRNIKLSHFLKSAFIRNIFKEHKEIKPITYKFNDRPLLNGKYLPVCFTHFIIQYLNAKYALEIAKYLTESLFDEQNKHNLTEAKKNAIKGGYTINNDNSINDKYTNYNDDIENSNINNEDNELIPTEIIDNLVNEFSKIPNFCL